MQSWGGHTYENHRPTEDFPTRSGITGILSSALGISREQFDKIMEVNLSYKYAVRETYREQTGRFRPVPGGRKLEDFHTVRNVRTTKGKQKEPKNEITRREYLTDTSFTAFLASAEDAPYSLEDFAEALKKPVFYIYLGRKSCPLSVPPFGGFYESDCIENLFKDYGPGKGGVVYSEIPPLTLLDSCGRIQIRDREISRRKFIMRECYYFSLPEVKEPEIVKEATQCL